VNWGKSFRFKRSPVVDWLTENVEKSSQGLPANGNRDRHPQVDYGHAAPESGCAAHGDGTHYIGVNMLLDL